MEKKVISYILTIGEDSQYIKPEEIKEVLKRKNIFHCKNENHKPRNNEIGITCCIRCGRLFTKPSEKDLEEDKIRLTVIHEL